MNEDKFYLTERGLRSVDHLALIVSSPYLTGPEVLCERLVGGSDRGRVGEALSQSAGTVQLVVQQGQLELLDGASRELEQVERVVERERVCGVHDVVVVGEAAVRDAEDAVVFRAQVVSKLVSNCL